MNLIMYILLKPWIFLNLIIIVEKSVQKFFEIKYKNELVAESFSVPLLEFLMIFFSNVLKKSARSTE